VTKMVQITRRSVCAGLFAGIVTALAAAQTTQTPGAIVLPSDADIRKMLTERVEALAGREDGIGIVVGIVGPQGRRVISYGPLSRRDPRSLSGNTVFEIGSVSKVFTALLLADMVQDKQVALSDPVATHTSGLPFVPDAVPVYNESAAKKDSAAQLYQFLARYE
jgi:serine-type D-Ala-D-Ala carboxypeptidase/endopeptidase